MQGKSLLPRFLSYSEKYGANRVPSKWNLTWKYHYMFSSDETRNMSLFYSNFWGEKKNFYFSTRSLIFFDIAYDEGVYDLSLHGETRISLPSWKIAWLHKVSLLKVFKTQKYPNSFLVFQYLCFHIQYCLKSNDTRILFQFLKFCPEFLKLFFLCNDWYIFNFRIITSIFSVGSFHISNCFMFIWDKILVNRFFS